MNDSNCTRAFAPSACSSTCIHLQNPLCQKVEAFFALHCPCCHGALALPVPLPEGISGSTNEEKVKWEKSNKLTQLLKGQQQSEENKWKWKSHKRGRTEHEQQVCIQGDKNGKKISSGRERDGEGVGRNIVQYWEPERTAFSIILYTHKDVAGWMGEKQRG